MTDSTSRLLGDRVSQLRQLQSMTLEQLAAASGVSRSMLSQIERGKANPTLAVTQRIAQTFGISIGELVDDPNASASIDVVRGDDPGTVFRADSECELRTLSPLQLEKNIEFYFITLQPGAELASAAHFEGTREMFSVSQGSATVKTGNSEVTLSLGDTAHYRADIPHSIRCRGSKSLKGFLVVSYR
ncbi:MAG: helix-turn-helix domain-containing protein [Congregibacter sp.]|nr:helix-turn-helix domain-containing protein [Congregibacter sp.]MDP5069821.1 helix-turn-helix domain-containing protein [Congregibacter sp.]